MFNYNQYGAIANYLNVSTPNGYLYAVPVSVCSLGGRDGTRNLVTASGTPNFSYSINHFFTSESDALNERLDKVRNPSTRLLSGEIGFAGGTSATAGATMLKDRSDFSFRHKGRSNIGFADGHIVLSSPGGIPSSHLAAFDTQDFIITH